MSRPRDPSKPSSLPAQRLKANPHDHLARFLDEEFLLGDGHTQVSALLKAYEWWCASRKAQNRQFTPVMLLDRLKEQYGIEPRNVRYVDEGDERFVYAMPGIRFRYDESLNWRLKYRGADTRTTAGNTKEEDE
jgi:hypothetical protein